MINQRKVFQCRVVTPASIGEKSCFAGNATSKVLYLHYAEHFLHQSSESNPVLRCRAKNARFAFILRSNLLNFPNNHKVLRHSLSFIGKMSIASFLFSSPSLLAVSLHMFAHKIKSNVMHMIFPFALLT